MQRSSSIKLTIFISLFAAQMAFHQTVNAQGKLGRVRSEVRTAKANSNSSENKSRRNNHRDNAESHDDHDSERDRVLTTIRENVRANQQPSHDDPPAHVGHNHYDHHHDRRRKRRRGRHSHGVSFFASSVNNCPTGFGPTIYPSVYGPAYYETVIVPAPGPVIVEQPVVRTVVAEPAIAEPVIAKPQVGDSYFDEPSEFETWSTKMTMHAGYDFDSIVQGGLSMLFQIPGGPGIDASANMLRESGSNYRDYLWVGDVNLVYELLGENVRARIGFGVNWLGDSYGGEAGVNLTAGTDLRLTNKTILSGEVDFGSLADADFFHGRVSLSRKLTEGNAGGAELMIGYDHYDIGGTEIGSVVTGLTLRF